MRSPRPGRGPALHAGAMMRSPSCRDARRRRHDHAAVPRARSLSRGRPARSIGAGNEARAGGTSGAASFLPPDPPPRYRVRPRRLPAPSLLSYAGTVARLAPCWRAEGRRRERAEEGTRRSGSEPVVLHAMARHLGPCARHAT
jgi:hypothetical protein